MTTVLTILALSDSVLPLTNTYFALTISPTILLQHLLTRALGVGLVCVHRWPLSAPFGGTSSYPGGLPQSLP